MKHKKTKYQNKPCVVDGLKFPSKGEGMRYQELSSMERQGLIKNLKLQVSYELAPPVVLNGRKIPPIKYKADFVYELDGKEVVEDFKGMRTPVYKLKRHLMKSVHGIDILETGG